MGFNEEECRVLPPDRDSTRTCRQPESSQQRAKERLLPEVTASASTKAKPQP